MLLRIFTLVRIRIEELRIQVEDDDTVIVHIVAESIEQRFNVGSKYVVDVALGQIEDLVAFVFALKWKEDAGFDNPGLTE